MSSTPVYSTQTQIATPTPLFVDNADKDAVILRQAKRIQELESQQRDVFSIVHNAHLTTRERIVLLGMISQTGNYPSSPQQYRTKLNLADLGAMIGAEVGFREGWTIDKYDKEQRRQLAQKAGPVVKQLSRLGYAQREVIKHKDGHAEIYNLGITLEPQSHNMKTVLRVDVGNAQTHIPESGMRLPSEPKHENRVMASPESEPKHENRVEGIPHVVEVEEPQTLNTKIVALVRSNSNSLSTDNKVVPINLVTSEVSTILNGTVATENVFRQEVDNEPEPPTAVKVPAVRVANLKLIVDKINDIEYLGEFYLEKVRLLPNEEDRVAFNKHVGKRGTALKAAIQAKEKKAAVRLEECRDVDNTMDSQTAGVFPAIAEVETPHAAVRVPGGGIGSTTYTPSSASSPSAAIPLLHIAGDHSENVDRSELADEMRSAFNMFRHHKVRVVYRADGSVDIGENLPSFMVNLVGEYRDRINQWIVSHYSPGDVIVAGKGLQGVVS